MDRRLGLPRHVVSTHAGQVFRTVGNGLCAAFATAPAAFAAALQAQVALVAEPGGVVGQLRARMALHTGAVEVRDGDYVGACLNRLGWLLGAGHGGQVLLSQATTDLANDPLRTDASLAALQGQPGGALRLIGVAAALRERMGIPVPPSWHPRVERTLEQSRQSLSASVAAAAWAEGQALTLDEAIALALSVASGERADRGA